MCHRVWGWSWSALKKYFAHLQGNSTGCKINAITDDVQVTIPLNTMVIPAEVNLQLYLYLVSPSISSLLPYTLFLASHSLAEYTHLSCCLGHCDFRLLPGVGILHTTNRYAHVLQGSSASAATKQPGGCANIRSGGMVTYSSTEIKCAIEKLNHFRL